jgi:hypothetical protein
VLVLLRQICTFLIFLVNVLNFIRILHDSRVRWLLLLVIFRAVHLSMDYVHFFFEEPYVSCIRSGCCIDIANLLWSSFIHCRYLSQYSLFFARQRSGRIIWHHDLRRFNPSRWTTVISMEDVFRLVCNCVVYSHLVVLSSTISRPGHLIMR